MSVIRGLICDVIPSQKCPSKMGPFLIGYGAVCIWNSIWLEPYVVHQGHFCVLQHRKFDDVVPLFCLLCVHTPSFSSNLIHENLGRVRFGDRSGQLCWPPRPIHRSGNCSFRYLVACRLIRGVLRRAGCTSYHLWFLSIARWPLRIGPVFNHISDREWHQQ
jgi:hypothetical protein